MDSPNSGSIQSSSGGDDGDYDSRAETILPYMNPMAYVSNAPPSTAAPPFHHHTTTSAAASLLDPLSNFFDRPLHNPTTPLLNLDPVWSKTRPSDPSSGEINPVHPSTSSFQPFFTSSTPSPQFPCLPESTPARAASSSEHTRIGVRNPKKRSRASRRAPTTVLTTDTTNFRAMVQEFTGIPAPPFTSSSSFPRSRFDLFGAPSHMRSNPLDSPQPPPYLLRPFAQKPQQIPPFSSPSLLNAIASTSTNNNSSSSSCNLSDFTFPKSLIPTSPNTFHSFFHSDPKYQGSVQIDSTAGLDEFGLTHGLPNLVSSDGAARANPENWGGGGGGGGGDQAQAQAQAHLRGINGNYDYSSKSVVKMNYLGTTSNFQGGNNKGTENVSSRGEGMVESWICSSD